MDLFINRDGPNQMDFQFANGDCPVTQGYSDAVAQRLYVRLRTFYADWYLNVEYGVPWLEKVLGKKIRKSTADMVIQEQILLERGVKRIVSFSSTLDNQTRQYECSFDVQTDEGDIVTLSNVSPF